MQPPLADGYHAVPPGKLATVVTYLEMLAPPPRTAFAAPDGVRLARVTDPDPDAYRALFRQIGTDWMWTSRLVPDEAELVTLITAADTEIYIPVRGDEALGLLELDVGSENETELRYFGIVPEVVGGGLGRWLMQEGLAAAWRRPGVGRVFVHTCHFDSPQALPFYIRAGFRPYARAVEIFDDPRLAGRLPETASAQVPLIRDQRLPPPTA
ncbi:GNAT family N-acetyltransferase [Methylobrevis albus]|uniref:GNAT family N-acetyltransferase n=1 Tax=Methylobrevis albus TaxID=2793297 RepID=A0A931MX64_9HYPH|nr:GNAT family N-acetyltransferase [Methylobrevis albus]MBH0236587.1 GNAT family N-acetyltransferase [Methylobrevis albus]